MSRFTDGPWVVDGEGSHIADVSKTWEVTAPTLDRMARPSEEEVYAVARLIAAAPMMLRALMHVEAVYRKNVVVHGEPSGVLDEIWAAIALATGATPAGMLIHTAPKGCPYHVPAYPGGCPDCLEIQQSSARKA